MENTDGQRMLTSLPEASDDSSQDEHNGANHGDDRERQSKKTKTLRHQRSQEMDPTLSESRTMPF